MNTLKFLTCSLLSIALLANTELIAQTLPDTYQFELGIIYDVRTGKQGNLKNGEKLNLWFSKGDFTGIETPKQKGFFMVMDLKDQKMITFMTDQKMAMVMDLAKMRQKMQGQVSDENQPAAKITKTGKTATILGYKATEYLIESDQNTASVWITTELGAGMSNFAKSLSAILQSGPKPMKMPSLKGLENGVMLKMLTTDKKSGDNSSFEAVEVMKDGKKMNTAGFNVMAMPGM